MFKIQWDKETGGVQLTSIHTKETLGYAPRPVFHEELDMLKLNSLGWKYPHCKAPLLWACHKQYFYKGDFVFEAKGANVYDDPTVIFQPGFEKLTLEPVNVPLMLQRCNDQMFLVESEAIEFIRSTYVQYAAARESVERVKANQLDYEAMKEMAEKSTKQKMAIVKQDCDSFDIMPLETAKQAGKKTYQTTKIDVFLASFSGGKDSQVVLDLCTRAIPPSAFEVIYSDTGYELPTSLQLYEEVQAYYKKKYPELKFSTARNHETVLNYWDRIGTPSDTHRWCFAVMKTAPLYRMLKVEGTNRQAKVLTFDGVRAEESIRRSDYGRIGKGVKHNTVINARPILNWNSAEIYLYLFKYDLPINVAYRQGHSRVGCIICPYSTSWDDMLCRKFFPQEFDPFLSRIVNFAQSGGIKDVENYVKERKWKLRASGNFLNEQTSVSFFGIMPTFTAKIHNAKQSIFQWLPTLGQYTMMATPNGYKGELQYNKNVYPYTLEFESQKNNCKIEVRNVTDAELIKLLKRVIYKTAYCIHCEVCEVECPTGALSVFPKVFIDKTKCIHCHKCLEFHSQGCIVANSLTLTTDTNMKAKSGIDRYNTFGLQEEWIDLFFADPQEYWNGQNGLGTKQVPAMKNWLRDAGIINQKNELTALGDLLKNIYMDYSQLVWEVIWINLIYNSFIAEWYARKIKTGLPVTKSLLKEMIQDEFPNVYSERTVKNAIDALINTLKKTPIGETLGQYEEINKESFKRLTHSDISDEAVAYSLYKFAELKEIHALRISDLYETECEKGPRIEFGILKSQLEKALRNLNSKPNRVLTAELNMGLDHITLRDDLSPLTALELLTK